MSTNPFRRSSLKGPSDSSGDSEVLPVASAPIDIPDAGTETPTPLTVNTKVSAPTQKHVNFASPPAIPISPVSYPPSPESTRISPAWTPVKIVPLAPANYSSAIQSDAIHAEAETDDDNGAIEQALENARVNTSITATSLDTPQQDAVRNTLSMFASGPKRPAAANRDAANSQTSAVQRSTMNVDAFKRLLLTGDSGQNAHLDDPMNNTAPVTFPAMNDNSSGTDTASISQRSLFDQGPMNDESPRSSDEMDPADAELIRRSLVPSHQIEGKKRPPPPAPRHGKPIREEVVPEVAIDNASLQSSPVTSALKNPPTPPLARRRSQNSGIVRPDSSRKSSSSELNQPTSLYEGGSRAPPPPRSRRPASTIERRLSSDLPPTMEESDSADLSIQPSRKTSGSRPAPPPARNSSKRVSMATLNPPPIPPPRRGRGSSRSSIDSQRPPIANILGSSSADVPSGESLPVENDIQRVSSNTSGYDILADLAALQREVDEARRHVSK